MIADTIKAISEQIQNQIYDNEYMTENKVDHDTQIHNILSAYSTTLTPNDFERVKSEFLSAGPLMAIIDDTAITEIIVCNANNIWFEKEGQFHKLNDTFYSSLSYRNFIHRLCDESQISISQSKPFADGMWKGFRVHISSPPCATAISLTLRKTRTTSIQLSTLLEKEWCSHEQYEHLIRSISLKKNLFIVGPTGSGKTTVLNSFLSLCDTDRIITIEDTSEILLPNNLSTKLLTYSNPNQASAGVLQEHLVKQCLRMRPDRIIMGEIRGKEAKDLLLALSTGHRGSMCTMHAHDSKEALIRLEMLVQMAVPDWSLDTIRRLIQFSIDEIIVVDKSASTWRLKEVHRISSLEKFGFITEEVI